jgi:hypothetical protein
MMMMDGWMIWIWRRSWAYVERRREGGGRMCGREKKRRWRWWTDA